MSRIASASAALLLGFCFGVASAGAQSPRMPLVQVRLVEAVLESQAGPVRILSIELETTRSYACNPPPLPLVHRADVPALAIDVGAVAWPPRFRIDPCSMREGPARGSVMIAVPPPGRYSLTLRRGSRSDRYELVVSEDAIELVEGDVRFSRRSGPARLTRVPSDAIILLCTERTEERCRTARVPPRPSCDALAAEPAIRSLTPLSSAPPYSMRDFNLPGARYLAPDLAPLRELLRERYVDADGCFAATISTGRGELIRNLR